MSPELEQLLEAYHDKRTCPPEEKRQRDAVFERFLDEAIGRKPTIRREQILAALRERYVEFRRQRLKVERERLSRLR